MKVSAPKPLVLAWLSLHLFFFFYLIPVIGFRSVGTKARMSFRQYVWIPYVRQPPINTHTHTHTHTHTEPIKFVGECSSHASPPGKCPWQDGAHELGNMTLELAFSPPSYSGRT